VPADSAFPFASWLPRAARPLARRVVGYFPGFLLVAALALCVDAAVMKLARLGGFGVEASVVMGYLTGNVASYLMLCRFVYRVAWRSPALYGRYFVGNMTGFVVRAGAVLLLTSLGLLAGNKLVVLIAVGLSFTTNYLVTTLWAIRPFESRRF
jgi:putative flippase GtrA